MKKTSMTNAESQKRKGEEANKTGTATKLPAALRSAGITKHVYFDIWTSIIRIITNESAGRTATKSTN